MDLVRAIKGRVYPVGRLDWASEGLLLLTNDGALANALMKAASHVAKTYVVKVAGTPDEAKLEKLRVGVSIAEKGGRRVRTAPAQIKLIKEGDNPWLEVIIIEGRNRQVRKMFEEVGHHVEKIRRVKYGPLSLDCAAGRVSQLNAGRSCETESGCNGIESGLERNQQDRNRARSKPRVSRPPTSKSVRSKSARSKSFKPHKKSRP
jgi:23S rRNA pseudouridine2605 synthase